MFSCSESQHDFVQIFLKQQCYVINNNASMTIGRQEQKLFDPKFGMSRIS